MTTIYLVRHGNVHNPEKIFYGRLPGYHLSELGKKQAAKLGEHLKTKKLAAIYASPLERAQETAAFIQLHHPHLPISVDERFIEVGAPVKDGTSFGDTDPLTWNFYTEDSLVAGGESLEDQWERMSGGLLDLARKHAGGEIVVVSHGDPIMVAKAKIEGLPLTFEHVRRKAYVETATGFALTFVGDTFSRLLPLIP